MQIPGRVGYQCSNYYRQLIKEGEIHDENYEVDENGKLTFKFRNSEGKSVFARGKESTKPSKPKKTTKRKTREVVDIPVEKKVDENVLPVSDVYV